MDYLGPDRESIGREKAGIMRAGRSVVVSDPVPPRSVIAHAEALGADLWLFGRDFNYSGDRQQWGWSGRGRRYNAMAYPALRGANQLINASGVLAALDAMRPRLSVPAQAVRNGLAMVELPGRFQVVPGQPTLVLDVAHNPHAAAVLAQNLDQMGYFPRTHAVLGAMADKDIAGLVGPLLPLVDAWYLCDLPTSRAATAQALSAAIEAARASRPAGSAPLPGAVLHCSSGPQHALTTALKGADPADRIVVFGSFHTVGGVLQHGLPRLGAAHVG
jgi:dihydrofolate synthase/folylpolyglutamate synthase